MTTKTNSRFWYSRKLSNWILVARLVFGCIIATHLILPSALQAAKRLVEDRGPHIPDELGPRWTRSVTGWNTVLLVLSSDFLFDRSRSTKPRREMQSSLICRLRCRSLFGSFINEPSWTIRGWSSISRFQIFTWSSMGSSKKRVNLASSSDFWRRC
jgi:hypothetical protein